MAETSVDHVAPVEKIGKNGKSQLKYTYSLQLN